MELVEVAPSRHPRPVVFIHGLGDKFVGNVHGDLAEVFTHALQHDAHNPV